MERVAPPAAPALDRPVSAAAKPLPETATQQPMMPKADKPMPAVSSPAHTIAAPRQDADPVDSPVRFRAPPLV
ncbi:MAG: hypothetical protein KJO67_14615, partial [Silicimonas sp.]|nr:hypothetical protein [Silicimonas sp.]